MLLQQNPALTPTTLQAKVTSLAVDLGTAGLDNLFGAGRLLLPTLPVNTVPPTITGTATVGATLTAGAGTWTGSPTFTYQWLRCDLAGANCATIAAATATTYLLVTADTGKTIRVDVTGTNGSGFSTARSAATAGVTGPPVNTALPVVSGSPYVGGSSLSVSTGTWTAFPAPTFSYQWQQCDSAGANCADINLATNSSYNPVSGDVGHTLRAKVKAANGIAPDATATSAATPLIGAVPANTVLPSITGTAAVGSILTAHDGTWTGSPTPAITRQWRRCNVAGSSCNIIGGATGATYTLVDADSGSTIRILVTATNAGGSSVEESAATSLVTGPPTNTALPTITGQASRGEVLTATTGSWTGFPTPTFAYQWRRCDSGGANCVNIGTNSSTYAVVNADVGSTIRVVVTASNGTSASATSVPTAVVNARPVNTVAPTITGTLAFGSVLTATLGTWDATPPVNSYSFGWFRCDDTAGNGCVVIPGASASVYTIVQADVGKTLKAFVVAFNAAGQGDAAYTNVSAVVTGPPANTGLPSISGTTAVGDTLTAANGTWSGYPAPTFTYQWRACDSVGANCSDLVAETASTHVITIADSAHTIRVVVTATNGAGSGSATSAPVGVPGPPSNLTPPSISGTTQTGSTLTAATGSWLGFPVPTFTYQWERCSALGVACTDIALANASTYVPGVPDLGLTLRVKVGASNTGGVAVPVESAATAVITAPPSGGGGGGGGAAAEAAAATTSSSPRPSIVRQHPLGAPTCGGSTSRTPVVASRSASTWMSPCRRT